MEAQKVYLEEQKYIETNRAHLDELLEQEQAAMMAQGPSSLLEAFTQSKKPQPGEGPEKKSDAESVDPAQKT
jgi:import inner membrane translocase subunit TIM50